MALRRRQGGISRSATFKEEKNLPPDDGDWPSAAATSSQSAQGGGGGGGPTYDYTSMGSSNETGSFWGVLARKAKAILEDDNMHQSDLLLSQTNYSPRATNHQSHEVMMSKKLDTPTPSYPAGKTALEGGVGGGLPYVENKGATNKIEIVRKGVKEGTHEVQAAPYYAPDKSPSPLHKSMQTKNPTTQEDLLKASRDVAMATAAKAKLLLRELKTIRADLAFAKQRCCQLEEENKLLRDAHHQGLNHADDDDMIRRQLETLLVEKARLAHENSVYARENRVLREIVEYHQMSSQDVVYLDENTQELEVSPLYSSISMPDSPTSSPPPSYLFRSASAHLPRH